MDNHHGAAALILQAAIFLTLAFISYTNSRIGKALMSTQDAVDALTAQVNKVGEEVTAAKQALTAELEAVKEQLANAGVAEQVDLSGLAAAIQAVDDINPDTVTEENPDSPPF